MKEGHVIDGQEIEGKNRKIIVKGKGMINSGRIETRLKLIITKNHETEYETIYFIFLLILFML